MSAEITTALIKGFRANFEILSQQKKSRLRDSVREESLTGEDDYFDQIGAADGADITDRHGDTQYATTPHDRRKVSPIPWEWADLIDGDVSEELIEERKALCVKRLEEAWRKNRI